jgi:hypothetical protein
MQKKPAKLFSIFYRVTSLLLVLLFKYCLQEEHPFLPYSILHPKSHNQMSKKNSLVIIFLATAFIYACSDEVNNETPQSQEVAFSFTVASAHNAGGRINADDLPSGTSLLISLADKTGTPVLTHHMINLLHLGDSYITEPLELAPGRYAITDFMLVSESEVLFATPQRNAPLAKLVIHSLPFSFVVGKDKVTNVEMEVIDASANKPEDFGYAAFDVHVVHPWRLSVFKTENGTVSLTDAKAYLWKDGMEQFNFSLAAKVNLLSFKGDTNADYTLLIKKPGYADYSTTFNYDNMKAALGDKPLKVVLEKIPAMVMTVSSSANFTLHYKASGTITVDWGDGTIESFGFDYVPPSEEDPYSDLVFMGHDYENYTTHYTLTMSGDVQIITSYGFYGIDPLYQLDVSGLSALAGIYFERADFEVLDVSQNYNLTHIGLNQQTGSIKSIKFPVENNINSFELNEVGDLNNVLGEIYNNTVANEIYDGRIDGWAGEPSDEVLEKVHALRDEWGWVIPFE